MKNLLLIMAGVAAVSFTSCDDDDDTMSNIEPASTRMEMITNRDWLLVTEEAVDGTPIALKTSPFSRDDIFRFKSNGEAIRDEGATKEDGKPQIVEVARWSFLNQERALDAGFQSLPLNDDIVELSKRRLVLRRIVNGAARITTFEAQ